MQRTLPLYTASISIHSILAAVATGTWGVSGSITLVTTKCYCRVTGCTAVHLVSSSFLGCTGFMGSTLYAASRCPTFTKIRHPSWLNGLCSLRCGLRSHDSAG